MRFSRRRLSFSLRHMLLVVAVICVAIAFTQRWYSTDRRGKDITDLVDQGAIVLFGCQTPVGTAPPEMYRDVVFIGLDRSIYDYRNMIGTSLLGRPIRYIRSSPYQKDPNSIDLGLLRTISTTRILDVGLRRLSDDDLSDIAFLHNLEVLVAPNAGKVSDAGLIKIAPLDQLKYLVISGPRVTDGGLAALSNWTELERLELHSTAVKGNGLRYLLGCHKLKRLDLTGSKIDDSVIPVIVRFSSLEELVLSNTSITNGPLEQLAKLPNLTMLDVTATPVDGVGVAEFRAARPASAPVVRVLQ